MSGELLSVLGATVGLVATSIGAWLAARVQRRSYSSSRRVEFRLGEKSVSVDASAMSDEELRSLLSNFADKIEEKTDETDDRGKPKN